MEQYMNMFNPIHIAPLASERSPDLHFDCTNTRVFHVHVVYQWKGDAHRERLYYTLALLLLRKVLSLERYST